MELKGTPLCLLGSSVSNYIYVYLHIQTKEHCFTMPCPQHSPSDTISHGPFKQIKEYSVPCVMHVEITEFCPYGNDKTWIIPSSLWKFGTNIKICLYTKSEITNFARTIF
jgi:hypothetical protein